MFENLPKTLLREKDSSGHDELLTVINISGTVALFSLETIDFLLDRCATRYEAQLLGSSAALLEFGPYKYH